MDNYLQKIALVERYFKNTKYDDLLNQTLEFYNKNNFKGLDECLKKFPDDNQLFETLVKKLQGKSVFDGLKDLMKENKDKLDYAKSISSLYTHCCIEAKKNPEYKLLLSVLLERLNNINYEL